MKENDKELEEAVFEAIKTPFLTPTKAGALVVNKGKAKIMFKKIFNIFLDYIAYVVLAMFGLFIVKVLYLVSLTEMGSAIMILITIVVGIVWSFYRLFNSKRE